MRPAAGGKPHQQGAEQVFERLLGNFHGVGKFCHAPSPNTLSHNSAMKVNFANVGIVGTGAMGRGIAQIAAQAGSTVKLMDAQAGAAEKAREAICAQWDKLVEKGRIDAAVAAGHKDRLLLAGTLADLAVATSSSRPSSSGWTSRKRCSPNSKRWCQPAPCWPATPLRCRSRPSPRAQAS
jgi:hypothetical protein